MSGAESTDWRSSRCRHPHYPSSLSPANPMHPSVSVIVQARSTHRSWLLCLTYDVNPESSRSSRMCRANIDKLCERLFLSESAVHLIQAYHIWITRCTVHCTQRATRASSHPITAASPQCRIDVRRHKTPVGGGRRAAQWPITELWFRYSAAPVAGSFSSRPSVSTHLCLCC